MLRENLGRLAVILAGGGCLALMIFVVWPHMNEPPPSMTPGEIVEEVIGPKDEQPGESQAQGEEVMPAPAPLVGVRDDGEEVPVIFPAPEGEMPEAQETGERAGVEAALPPVLSAEDVAAAKAALAGDEEEVVEGMTPEDWVRVASAPDAEPLETEGGQAPEVIAERDEAVDTVVVEPDATETTAAEAVVEPQADATEAGEVAASHPVAATGADSQASLEGPDPSGELPSPPAPEAGQADGPNSGLSPQRDEVERTGVVMPGTLRGVMGYRLPLVSRQEVPDQIVSGVLIPAHTTFVILKEGAWELVDVSAAEVDLLRQLASEREAEAAAGAEPAPEPERRGWNPLRMLKQRKAPADE